MQLPRAGRQVAPRVNGKDRALTVADYLQQLTSVGAENTRAAKRQAESIKERRDLPSSPVVDSSGLPQL